MQPCSFIHPLQRGCGAVRRSPSRESCWGAAEPRPRLLPTLGAVPQRGRGGGGLGAESCLRCGGASTGLLPCGAGGLVVVGTAPVSPDRQPAGVVSASHSPCFPTRSASALPRLKSCWARLPWGVHQPGAEKEGSGGLASTPCCLLRGGSSLGLGYKCIEADVKVIEY